MPFFSVVIPAYNREHLIERTLASVFAQNRPDLEVIVVDDGSTDDTREVVRRYGDRVTLLTQENQGPGAARNAGIREAQGEYVAFLDSDDLWFPWTLDVYETAIRDHQQPAFVAGSPFLFTDADAVEGVEEHSPQATYFPDYYASGDAWRWWGVSSFVVRREALQAVGGFSDRWINAEDADLAMRLGVAPGFVDLDDAPTFAYREHDDTAMDVAENTIRGIQHLIQSENDHTYPGGDERAVERYRILCRHVRPVVLSTLRSGRSGVAWELYWATLRWHVYLHRWKFLLGFPVRSLQYRTRSASYT